MVSDLDAVDIINVVSVTQQAQVNQMIEDNDDDIQNSLYWRQALDVRTFELSVSTLFDMSAWSGSLTLLFTPDDRLGLQMRSPRQSR